jgi:hypothetical protein
MALNPSPNFPPIGVGPYLIDRQWCMGDSLSYINENFRIFDDRTLTLSSTFVKQISAGQNITVTSTLTSNVIAISNTIVPAIVQVQYHVQAGSPNTTDASAPAIIAPTSASGALILEKAITPKFNNSFIRVDVSAHVSNQTPAGGAVIALFKDSGTNAIATSVLTTADANNIRLQYIETVSSMTPITYRVRMYTNGSGNLFLNRDYPTTNTRGDTFKSYLTLEEFRP